MTRPIHIVLGFLFLLIPGLVGCSKTESKQTSQTVIEEAAPPAAKSANGHIAFYRVSDLNNDLVRMDRYANGGVTPRNTKFFPADADSGDAPGLLLELPSIFDDDEVELMAAINPFPGNENQGVINFSFAPKSTKIFADYTSDPKNYRTRFAIVFQGKIVSAPHINSPILTGEGYIEGNWTIAEAEALIEEIRAGPGNDTP